MLKWDAFVEQARQAEASGNKEAAAKFRQLAEKAKEKARYVLPKKIEVLEALLERSRKGGDTALIANIEANIKNKKDILESITPHVSPVTEAAKETAAKEKETEGEIDE